MSNLLLKQDYLSSQLFPISRRYITPLLSHTGTMGGREGQQLQSCALIHTHTQQIVHLFIYTKYNSPLPGSTLRTGGCHGNSRIPWAMHEPAGTESSRARERARVEKTESQGYMEMERELEKLFVFLLSAYNPGVNLLLILGPHI